jgi:hypothetical protein
MASNEGGSCWFATRRWWVAKDLVILQAHFAGLILHFAGPDTPQTFLHCFRRPPKIRVSSTLPRDG